MKSQKPYFIRAIFNWCCDNNLTPFISVKVDKNTVVPDDFVINQQITLNINPRAVKYLQLSNDWITFEASFSGVVYNIIIPVANVIAIFNKENGTGMQFEAEHYDEENILKPSPLEYGGLKLYK